MFPFPKDPVAQGLTAEGVVRLCDDGLAHATQLVERIRQLATQPDSTLTWEATFGAFDDVAHAIQEAILVPKLVEVNHPDKAVRDAAMTCEPKVNAFTSALLMDDVVASVLKRAATTVDTSSLGRPRLVEYTLRDYRRNGLELPAESREKLRLLNEEISQLGQQFQRNLAETSASIEVTPEQLEGLPPAYIASHAAQENGKVCLTSDYPDLIPFLRYAKDRTAARQLYALSQDRAADKNIPLLDQLLKLRHEKAALLGYATWADYVLEPRMAKSPATVKTFLDDLHGALKPKRAAEFIPYQAEADALGITVEGRVSASDSAYLEDRICTKQFSLDSQKLSEYFEVTAVRAGIMEIASRLYNIRFEPSDVPTWHADVTPFEVKDAASGEPIGRVYLDLYPREGKFKHAAMFDMRASKRLEDGSRLLPLGALVCNFPKTGVAPGLLSHQEVVTFFHEFGHLLHHVLTQSPLASFSGASVAWDFVEAPSQMFEEWAWSREMLDLFARHHASGERLPDALFEAMTKARTFGDALHTERQLFLATLDQTYHTRAPGFDTTAVVHELHAEYSPFLRVPNTHFQATWGHLIGYDAAYYGYQWALAIAFDLLTRFQAEGLMNTQTSQGYRNAILEMGSTEDEAKLVETFLGRPTNTEAYKKYLGINA